MALNKIPDGAHPDDPVLSAPPGVAPRGLRSDPFAGREELRPPPRPKPETPPENPFPPPSNNNEGPRGWDFAMPAASAAPRESDPHLNPDVNWRRHVGLRPPGEAAFFSDTARERFNENWERLASEPARTRHGTMRRTMEKSAVTRWLFHRGSFELGNALGALLLIGLLVAAAIYCTRVLTGTGNPHPPAAQSSPN